MEATPKRRGLFLILLLCAGIAALSWCFAPGTSRLREERLEVRAAEIPRSPAPPPVALAAEELPARSNATPIDLRVGADPEALDLRGGWLQGSVVDAHGKPVAGAAIKLYQGTLPGPLGGAVSGEDGTFSLHFVHSGTYELVASARGRGVATFAEQWIEERSGGQEPLVIALAQSDTIAGILSDPEDHRLANAELWAFPARLSAAGDRALFEWRLRPEASVHAGECSLSVHTDAHGRFRFEGLAPGAYFVAPAADLCAPWLERQGFSTGELNARVTVRRWELRLSCVAAGGGQLDDARAFCAPVQVRGPSDLLLEPREHVEGSPEWVFEVEGSRVYRCGFVHASRGVVEEEIFIPSERYSIAHAFVLRESQRPGSLRVDLLGLGRGYGEAPRRVRVRSRASGVLLWSWTQNETAAYELAPGEYALEVADPPPKSWNAAWGDLRVDELLLDQRTLRIDAGAQTRVELHF